MELGFSVLEMVSVSEFVSEIVSVVDSVVNGPVVVVWICAGSLVVVGFAVVAVGAVDLIFVVD